MITVVLHGAEFFAKHGFYPEEQVLGARFMVDIEVGFETPKDLNEDKLKNTVNYEQLYDIAHQQMHQTRQLIETVAQAIVDQIKTLYANIDTIKVSLKKLNPPLQGNVKYSAVVITYNRPVNGI